MTGGLRYPPFARPGARTPTATPAREELPSIDEFIDELPPIEDFLAAEGESFEAGPTQPEPSQSENAQEWPEPPPPVSVDSAQQGWAEGAWQSYDWEGLSSLTRTPMERPSAAESWGDSEWPGEEDTPSAGTVDQGSGRPTADEVAGALDLIAHRIRSGELVIDNLNNTPPEAAMAAALAVLLRSRG